MTRIVKPKSIVKVQKGEYVVANVGSIRRENGKTPNGNDFNGVWVFRNVAGDLIDFDQYRNDLFARHDLVLKDEL